jgi:hypothetical protein
MLNRQILAVFGRALIVLGLFVLSFGTPAMASGNPADCMSMMQDGGQMSETMPGMDMQCPYAAVCAVSGLYVAPAPPSDYAMADMSDAGYLSFDETIGVGLMSSPPSRPPRS